MEAQHSDSATRGLITAYGIPALALAGLFLHLGGLGNIPLIAVIVIGGLPLLWGTAQAVRRGEFNVDLVAIASIFGGLFLGQYLAAAIIVLMMSGGEALETFALRRASGSLQALLQKRPRLANRWNGKTYEETPVEKVMVGDRILVRPGESVPTDGEITEGSSEFNESLLTGESLPVTHKLGERILSGSINISGPVTVEVTAAAEESTYARIIELVKSAQNRKARVQRLADRFGAWFTPLTFLMVLATWLFTHNSVTAYAVLVIATPCPLILATPVAVVAGIGRAAKLGIIIKSGEALEAVAQASTVLFDKTGTLTAGTFSLTKTELFGNHTEEAVLRLAASLAHYSNHAISRSLGDEARRQHLKLHAADEVKEIPGNGIQGIIDGKKVRLGSAAFVGVTVEEPAIGAGQVCLAIDGKLAAVFTLQDTIRPESHAVVAALRTTYGIPEVAMLTGDRAAVAQNVAEKIGGLKVHAELRPEDKLRLVAEAAQQQKAGHTAVMVGDGINDAPALERADVGIAIGRQGGEVAVEAADIVLLGDRLQKLPDSIRIGRAVLRIATQGILFGMGCSFLGMLAAAFGFLPPVAGALLQEVIDALVIFNALRVLRV